MIAMIGTSDRLCWLAETCKILLLLLFSCTIVTLNMYGYIYGHSFINTDFVITDLFKQ